MLSAFREKYPLLDDVEITIGVEKGISDALTNTLGAPAIASWSPETGVEMVLLSNREATIIDTDDISRKVKRHINYCVERELTRRQILAEHKRLKFITGTVQTGEITSVAPDGKITVWLTIDTGGLRAEQINAVLPLRFQPANEREEYQPGQVRAFYVVAVLPVEQKHNGLAFLYITVSRAAKEFPAAYLRSLTGERDIHCIERLNGSYSRIQTRTRLPKNHIVTVSRELGERINVRIVQKT